MGLRGGRQGHALQTYHGAVVIKQDGPDIVLVALRAARSAMKRKEKSCRLVRASERESILCMCRICVGHSVREASTSSFPLVGPIVESAFGKQKAARVRAGRQGGREGEKRDRRNVNGRGGLSKHWSLQPAQKGSPTNHLFGGARHDKSPCLVHGHAIDLSKEKGAL
jgi:hypothetical protein